MLLVECEASGDGKCPLPQLVIYVCGLLRGGVEDCARTGRRAQYIDHVSIDLTLDKIITRTVRIGHKLPELVVYVRGLLRGGVENCARTGRRAQYIDHLSIDLTLNEAEGHECFPQLSREPSGDVLNLSCHSDTLSAMRCHGPHSSPFSRSSSISKRDRRGHWPGTKRFAPIGKRRP